MGKNLLNLHIHVPRSNKTGWFNWAVKLKEKSSYFCSALARVDAAGKIIRQFAPEGSDATNPAVIKAAYEVAANRLRQGWKDPETHFASEKQRARSLGKSVEIQNDIEGSEVTVWASGKVHFLWNDADNKTISFAIGGSHQLVPSSAEDKRFIRFQPEDIAIVDQMGNLILRRDQSQDDTVTWTTKQLGLLPEREDLRKCWEHHVPNGHWTTDGDIEESDEL